MLLGSLVLVNDLRDVEAESKDERLKGQRSKNQK